MSFSCVFLLEVEKKSVKTKTEKVQVLFSLSFLSQRSPCEDLSPSAAAARASMKTRASIPAEESSEAAAEAAEEAEEEAAAAAAEEEEEKEEEASSSP